MRPLTPRDRKAVILGLLEYFDQICRNNNIEYTLAGGSLLGAVRHGGFIPWDDDGDVIVTRENYKKLQIIFRKMNNSRFGYLDENSDGYFYAFAKLYDRRTEMIPETPQDYGIKELGVYLDIFPVDEIPEPGKRLVKYHREIEKISYRMYASIPRFYYYSPSKIKKIIKRFVFFPKYVSAVGLKKHNPDYWKKELLEKLVEFDGKSEKNAGYILSEYKMKESIPKSVYESYKDIKFDKLTLRSINDTNTYLTALYGNYMQLPPKNSRAPKHAYIGSWR